MKIAISEWVINECIAAIDRKTKQSKNKLTRREAFQCMRAIADLLEGKIEQIDLSLYPISEKVIRESRITIVEIGCKSAADALHVYVADKSNCDYFVTADNELYETIKDSKLIQKLTPFNIWRADHMLSFFSGFDYFGKEI